MTRRVMGPFNRVEGDLEVQLDIADGRVRNAWVTSPLYRGFERMLVGKDPRDAEKQPGPSERALIDAPVRPDEREPLAVQHIVRSFDPCMVCTVH